MLTGAYKSVPVLETIISVFTVHHLHPKVMLWGNTVFHSIAKDKQLNDDRVRIKHEGCRLLTTCRHFTRCSAGEVQKAYTGKIEGTGSPSNSLSTI